MLVLLIGLVFKAVSNVSVFPLSPIEILYIVLIVSGFPAMGLGMTRANADIMTRKPHDVDAGVFTPEILLDMAVCTSLPSSCVGAMTDELCRRCFDCCSLPRQLHPGRLRFRRWKFRNRLQQFGRKWIGDGLPSSIFCIRYSHVARVDPGDGDARSSSFVVPNDPETRTVRPILSRYRRQILT